MTIEVEYFGITGMIGPSSNDVLFLGHAPTTGPYGLYDVALDPTDGPAQRYGIDFGVTHTNLSGATAGIALNLANSDIKYTMNNPPSGVTGILFLRAIYNY